MLNNLIVVSRGFVALAVFRGGLRPPAPVSTAVLGLCGPPLGRVLVVLFAPRLACIFCQIPSYPFNSMPNGLRHCVLSYALLEGEEWTSKPRASSLRCWRALRRARGSHVSGSSASLWNSV